MKDTSKESIVITGLGCMLPGSDTPEAFWERLSAGDSALQVYENEQIQTRLIPLFGHIDAAQRAKATQVVPFKLRRYSTPSSQWGVKSARDAVERAGLDLESIPEGRRGIFTAQGDYMYPSMPSFGGGLNNAARIEDLDLKALTREFIAPRGIDPFVSIKGLANNLLAIAALTFGLRGDCGAFVQDDSAFLGALRAAVFSLRHGYCDVALVICGGSYNEAFTLTELYQMGRLSRGGSGAASMRPFDAKCDGAVLGEGAAAFLLERGASASARGGRPLAVLSGFGGHLRAGDSEDGNCYERCAHRALEASGLSMQAIDGIVAHGRSEAEADLREAQLLRTLLSGSPALPITCATGITGLIPACPLELIAALGSLQRGELFPIPHLEDPVCRELPLLRQSIKKPLQQLLALSAHANGWHTAIHLSHPEALPA